MLRSVLIGGLKLVVLLLLTTVAAGLVMVASVRILRGYYTGDFTWSPPPDSSTAWIDSFPAPISLLFLGVGASLMSLAYLHVLLAYLFLLRHLPNFWKRVAWNFLLLTLGTLITTVGIPLLFMSKGEFTPAAFLFLPGIGLWATALLMFFSRERTPQPSHSPPPDLPSAG